MKKKSKKGFTLVELLVVIAILAILATVSIVGYTSFIGKANQSVDEQAVTQMNVALEAQEAIGAPKNVEEAKVVLTEAGFNVDSYVPLNKDNIFYYDEAEVRVLIYNQEEQRVTFPKNLEEKYSNFIGGNKSGTWYILNDKTYEWVYIDELVDSNVSEKDKLAKSLLNLEETDILYLDKDYTLSTNVVDNKVTYYSTIAAKNNATVRVDLQGHKITLNSSMNCVGGDIFVDDGSFWGKNENIKYNLIFSNGIIEVSSAKAAFTINNGSSLTLNNIKYSNSLSANVDDLKDSFKIMDNANLTLENCVIENTNGDTSTINLLGDSSQTNIFNSTLLATSYGITTNASGNQSWNVNVNIQNSKITTLEGPAVLVNVPGQYRFLNSTLEGNGHGVVIRGGDASFVNCTIKESGDNKELLSSVFIDQNGWEFSDTSVQIENSPFNPNGLWKEGNKLQFGGLVVGDWNNAYSYDSSCTLVNTSVYMNDKWTSLPIVYLSQDSEYKTTFKYDEKCKFYNNNQLVNSEESIKENSSGEITKGEIIIEAA